MVAMVEGETIGVQFDGDKSDVGVICHLQVLWHVVLQTSVATTQLTASQLT